MRWTTPLLVGALLISSISARAGDPVADALTDPLTIAVQVGPVEGAPSSTRSVSFARAPRRTARLFDVQDGREHLVRGLPLREVLALVNPPKGADTVLVLYTDGMQIPVRLADKATLDALFVAFEQGDAMDRFQATYTLHGWGQELPCPKLLYSGKPSGKSPSDRPEERRASRDPETRGRLDSPRREYTIWRYPTQLSGIELVTWKLHEAALAQPTRKLPDRSGWPLYLTHCQPCHGIGGQGATRGPDFLGDLQAYRKVPAHAETGWNEHPSLHEKIKGYVEGTMPVLDQVSNGDITKLWRWLEAVHRSATK